MIMLMMDLELFRILVCYDSWYVGMKEQNGLVKTGASKRFNGKRPHRILQAGSREATIRFVVSDVPKLLYYN